MQAIRSCSASAVLGLLALPLSAKTASQAQLKQVTPLMPIAGRMGDLILLARRSWCR